MRILLLAPLGLLLGACGIVTGTGDGHVKGQFTVTGDRIDTIVLVNPNDEPAVAENRDKIEAGTVLDISLELVEILPENMARQVAGQIDVRVQGQGDDAWIMAVGEWAGVPLYNNVAPDNQPAVGQKFTLNLPTSTLDELSNIVFKQTNPIELRLNGSGYDDYLQPASPTNLKGEVDVHLSVTFSAP